MRMFLSSLLLAGFLSVGAMAAEPTSQPSAQPVNKICPVEGDAVDPNITTQYEGKTIGFCCKDCPAKFKGDPEKYMKNLK